MKMINDNNDYEKGQLARGIAFANECWTRRDLEPDDADLDSAAFVRGFLAKQEVLYFSPFSSPFHEEIDMTLSILGLKHSKDYGELYWQLEQLVAGGLFDAIFGLVEKYCVATEESETFSA